MVFAFSASKSEAGFAVIELMGILLFEIGLWGLKACDARSKVCGALKPVLGLKKGGVWIRRRQFSSLTGCPWCLEGRMFLKKHLNHQHAARKRVLA